MRERAGHPELLDIARGGRSDSSVYTPFHASVSLANDRVGRSWHDSLGTRIPGKDSRTGSTKQKDISRLLEERDRKLKAIADHGADHLLNKYSSVIDAALNDYTTASKSIDQQSALVFGMRKKKAGRLRPPAPRQPRMTCRRAAAAPIPPSLCFRLPSEHGMGPTPHREAGIRTCFHHTGAPSWDRSPWGETK